MKAYTGLLQRALQVRSHNQAVGKKTMARDQEQRQYAFEWPLLRVKIEMEWEQCELDNPEVTRVGYTMDRDRLRSRQMLENQVPWRLEWMRKNEGSLEIYRDLPRELRIDPTYCPC